MSDLAHEDFAAFFRDVHGYAPFPWQQRLTDQVLVSGKWPKVIDLPTGSGKTAVLDTAVFAIAARPEISPRRVVFVIDRRIVVDQVHERAQRIRHHIIESSTEVLARVKSRLQSVSGDKLLGVAALRGGIPVEDKWAERPDQPWVMVSTVDQFGSRLLFRGYGVTRGMRPIHAGLAGNDCLVILDEVHLSTPFAETLTQVAKLKSGGLPRRFQVVEMSATPSSEDALRFKLDSEDLACAEMRRRVEAAKEAKLVSVPEPDSIPAEVVKIVKSNFDKAGRQDNASREETPAKSIGVVVNWVRTARETHRALAEAGFSTHLITGRMRPLDKIEALDRIGPAVDPDSDGRPRALTVVVATQSIEVGADFSFNALITECAAVDSLRQRFGRLDRRGTDHQFTGQPAKAWIIGPKSVVNAKKPDFIYGESVKVTWEELSRRAEEGPIAVGPSSLRDFPMQAIAPRPDAPLLLKTHIDAWTQTNPEPLAQPLIEWFLHGLEQERAPDVSIVWRWDRSVETLKLIPPRQAEFLPVPIAAAKAWLSGADEINVADTAQALGKADDALRSQDAENPEEDGGGWIRWRGIEDSGTGIIGTSEIRPGDIIIVDPRRGGLRAGTWDPHSQAPIEDLGDAAQIAYGKRATLRLDVHLPYMNAPPSPEDEIETDVPARERIEEWLNGRLETPRDLPAWFVETLQRLSSNPVIDVDRNGSYYILTERNTRTNKPVVDAATMDGSDEAGSMIGTGVTLSSHMDGVGNRAGSIARRLGLPAELVADLRLAGRLHDVGKVDVRFQSKLVGDDPVELAMQEAPLAKSLPGVRLGRAYPRRMRHELASVALVSSNADVLNMAFDPELVLHLVGTHHGYGRPLPPVIEDDAPQKLSYAFDGHMMKASSDLGQGQFALAMADRFWRLVERYGHHGLAWLEAIVRLADHQQSADEAG